ncbi:Protein ACCELERATED CELL DEATH 6-like [Quillaja saponaria]|uniref:Protein ACCELERATED CELL DEATH 6-like n=1 Tax=Quillaja saponaria TaxID=32244 RepID=A0AAD7QHB6_QUISA|nr:Protein ACCELERATED CELL DEATH 6-like [Quillaja saponaria]
MGVLDLKIELETSKLWEEINERIERLRKKSNQNVEQNPSTTSSSSVEEHGATQNPMDFDLYKATIKGDIYEFIDVLERVSTEKGLPLSAIFDQVSPLQNTYLHVAASFERDYIVAFIAHNFISLLTRGNSNGDTPLHVALRKGKVHTASLLCRYGGDTGYGFSPVGNGKTKFFDDRNNLTHLIRLKNKQGNTALHMAVTYRSNNEYYGWYAVRYLIELDPEYLPFSANKEGKSPFFLAVEAENLAIVDYMLTKLEDCTDLCHVLRGKSPINAALVRRNKGLLETMLNKLPVFIHSRFEEGDTPLSFAASIGYLEGVKYLVEKYSQAALETNQDGLLPIHVASRGGYVDILKKLLQHCPDLNELLTKKSENILHVAAKNGKVDVVNYILKSPELKMLLNEKDEDGNTPLHLAAMHWHPKVVSSLTWDNRISLKIVNDDGMTALDVSEAYLYMEKVAPFRKRLTGMTLKSAGAPKNFSGLNIEKLDTKSSLGHCQGQKPATSMEYSKDRVNTLLLMSTLVATITFAAGFTMPGGYNNTNPDQGMATMLHKHFFAVFLTCDSIAMYSSIIVAVALIWVQLGDLNLVLTSLRVSLPLLGLALAMMSLAFMAGVFLVVSRLVWLANLVLIMETIFLIIFLILFTPLFFPNTSSYRVMRYISYYNFCLLMWASGSYSD